MSKKIVLSSLAMAIAMTFAGSAMATATITVGPPSPLTFAHEVLGVNALTGDPKLTVASSVTLTLAAPEILVGRTNSSGDITVQLTFAGGTLDSSKPAPTIGSAASGSSVNTGTISISGNTLQFTISPGATPGITAGTLFTVSGVAFKDAGGLATGNISASAKILDTNTATVLTSADAQVLVVSDYSSATVLTGDTDTIDVGVAAAKLKFVGNKVRTKMGTVAVSNNNFSVNGTSAFSNASGAAGTGNFIYDVANDVVDLTLTVPNDSGFTAAGSFYAVKSGACLAGNPATHIDFVKNATTLKYEAVAPISTTTGDTYTLCAVANGGDEIQAQTIALTSQVNLAGALTIDPPAVTKSDFTVWGYNGSVVNVYQVNPANNTLAQSYVRIINKGSVGGAVSITGYDDNGTAYGPMTLTGGLAAGHSKQINSDALEDATKAAAAGFSGTLGDGVGKWRLVVTGEFPNMVVQSLNRNNSTGTVTNLTDADTKKEQANNAD